VLFLAVLLFGGYVGLRFLGNQVAAILGGTVEFGTGGSGCGVESRATVFAQDAGTIRAIAHLRREVEAGAPVTIRLEGGGAVIGTFDETFPNAGQCVFTRIDVDQLDPGSYALVLVTGAEELAKGSFEVTP
jgi:hypothetical protein